MADVHISTKNLLQCPVCLDRFSHPRSLPCLHTFCSDCLHSHITNVSQSSLLSTFPCPVCRAHTKPPRPYSSRDTWVSQFPVNHWIVSVLEEAELKENEEVVYCEQHTEQTICMFCDDHTSPCCPKCVALYHRQCDKVVDIESVVHKWDRVKDMEDVSKRLTHCESQMTELEKQNVHESNRFGNEVKDIEHKVKRRKEKLIAHIDMLERQFMAELKSNCGTVDDMIDQSRKTWVEVNVIFEEAKLKLHNIEANSPVNAFIKLNMIRQKLSEYPVSAQTFRRLPTLHFEMNETFDRIEDIRSIGKLAVGQTETNVLEDNSTVPNNSMSGDSGAEKSTMIDGASKDLNVGKVTDTLCVKHSAANDNSETLDSESTEQASRVREIAISEQRSQEINQVQYVRPRETFKTLSVSNGSKGSWVTSAVAIKNKVTVLCDSNSKSLKLFKDRKLIFEEKRRTSPWCVDRICDSFLTVTYPEEKLIRIFDVKYNAATMKFFGKPTIFGCPMRLSSEISTKDRCYGVCYSGELLFVACETSVKLFSLDGYLKQTFGCNESGEASFNRLVSAAVDSAASVCYVVDEAINAVYAFNINSRHCIDMTSSKFVYKHDNLRGPQNIAIGMDGELYITGFVSKNVHVISSDGHIRRVIRVQEQPWALYNDKKRNTILLSFFPENNMVNNIHIYGLNEWR